MQYNKHYRKPETKSIEAKAFWNKMMEGLTAQEYVEAQLAKVKVIRNSEHE